MKSSPKAKYGFLAAVLVMILVAGVGLFIIRRSQAFNADVNADSVVNILDLSILASHFAQSGQSFATGDLNGDGYVNIIDLSILASLWNTFTLDQSFDRPSKSDPDNYRQKVDFNVVCLRNTSVPVARIAADDPIVFPSQPGAAHMHVFVGNTSVNAFSTQASLEAGGTRCLLDRDTATYWMPQLYTGGTASVPYHARLYYRAGSLNPVAHIPRGLKIIAGSATATTPQDKKIAGWQCRSVSPDLQTIAKQATIPTCASNDLLEGSVVFPNCWDGVNLDSADHKSHMSYSWADNNPDDCDSAHPVQLPQLTVAYRYTPGTTNSSSYLSAMNSGLTLHADFWNAWHQPTLDALVDRCINAGVHCGDVDASHFPGPMP